jgi:D-3-phosphoglycerate dehydrogenase
MKIVIASHIDPACIEQLETRHEVVRAFEGGAAALPSAMPGADILVVRSGVQITRALMQSAPGLGLLIRAGSGVDNIDLDYLEERRIPLVRIPEPGATAVAEMSFCLMLALCRRLVEADGLTRGGRWAKHELVGRVMHGKVLGIVGLGNIGCATAHLGIGWGMEVVGCVQRPSAERAAALAGQQIRLLPLEQVLDLGDFVSVHLSLTETTRGLIGREAIARMKNDAILVNLARGGVVDEMALLEAMRSGKLWGAGLDVHAEEGDGRVSPLADLPNVILTPHIGSTTRDTMWEIGERILEEVAGYGARSMKTSRRAEPGSS